MTFTNLILTFDNRDWLGPVSDFFMGTGALSVEILEKSPVLTVLTNGDNHADQLLERFTAFRRLMEFQSPDVSRKTLTDTDWIAAFRSHFTPFQMSRSLKVIPEWEATEQDRGSPRAIVVDPGQAFGTGLHATTALAAQFLVDTVPRKRSFTMMDVGCGSGILSIAGAKNGAAQIIAFDVDPLCSRAVHRHAALNHIPPERILTYIGTHQSLGKTEPVDVLVINIIETVIRDILPDIRHLAGKTVIISGVLNQDAPGFVAWLEGLGLKTIKQAVREEWAAVCCEAT